MKLYSLSKEEKQILEYTSDFENSYVLCLTIFYKLLGIRVNFITSVLQNSAT